MSIDVQKLSCKVVFRVQIRAFSVLICYSAMLGETCTELWIKMRMEMSAAKRCLFSYFPVYFPNKHVHYNLYQTTQWIIMRPFISTVRLSIWETLYATIMVTHLAVRIKRKYKCQYEALVENISFLIQLVGSVYFTSNWELENGPKCRSLLWWSEHH